MPRPLLTNATLELRTDSAEAPPTPGSPRIEADDAGRLRWDSWFRSRSDMPLAVETTRTDEHQVLMLLLFMPGLSVPLRGHSLLPGNLVVQIRGIPADAYHRSLHSQRISQCADVTDSTRWFHENHDTWAECEDAQRALDTPTPFSRSENTANALFRSAFIAADRRARPARIPSAHVYLPLGA